MVCRFCGPEGFDELIARDKFARVFRKIPQNLERLSPQGNLRSAPTQDAAQHIKRELVKAQAARGREFAREVRGKHPDKLLAYNCSPSFNWRARLEPRQIDASRKNWRRWVTSSSSSH